MLDTATLDFLPPSLELKLALPLASFSASAGFPSPADDYLEGRLDLNDPTGFTDEAMTTLAAHIRRTVRQWTGIAVSVGIGPTKTLAKAASRLAKQHPDAQGVLSLLTPSAHHAALSTLPVGDVWGIGRQWAKLLESQGVTTALALSEQSDLCLVGWRLLQAKID